jgi:hypothetical protein
MSVVSVGSASSVGEHGRELLARERLHVREPEREVVALPAQRAEARNLDDRRVEVAVDEHVVDPWRVELRAQPLDRVEQRRRVGGAQLDPRRRRQLDGKRPEDGEGEHADRDPGLREEEEGRRLGEDRQHEPGDARDRQPERPEQDRVAAERPGPDAHAVPAGIGLRLLCAPPDEVVPLVVGHGHPVSGSGTASLIAATSTWPDVP